MSVAAPARAERRLDLAWVTSTSLLAGLMALFAYAHVRSWVDDGRSAGLAFALQEILLVGVFIARRRPLVTSTRLTDWLVAMIGGYAGLLLRPSGHALFGVERPWVAVQILGLAGAVWTISQLGRSFGVVAANRGVKVSGPYRFVRHPMYACYLLSQLGYVLGYLSVRNVAVFALAVAGQILRMRAEERVLDADPSYQSYRATVSKRIVPGLY